KLRCDALPWPLALVTFDSAVNAGQGTAARWLQRALGVQADGIIGKHTIAAANHCNAERVAIDILTARNLHNASLPTFERFGRGWSKRLFTLASNLKGI